MSGLTPRATSHGESSERGKLYIFGIFMQKYTCLWMGFRFYEELGFQKLKIHANFDFLPLFELQKAALGEMTFEGSNQLQIKKFQWGWKLDSHTFPMSYLAPDLDTGKALKQSCQCARPVKVRGATTQGNFTVLTSSASKTLFLLWLTFEACK